MKTIVTHMSVDLDAVTSAWLVRKYFPGWQEAQFAFVPIEQTLNNLPPDTNCFYFSLFFPISKSIGVNINKL
jgi:hypothetical protein